MVYDFQTQLRLGKLVEKALDDYFSTKYQVEAVTLKTEIDCGYDRVFHVPGRSILVEYKADFKSARTGNAYVELEVISQNRTKGGWANHSIADIIVYAVIGGNAEITSIYNIDREKMQATLPQWSENFRTVECMNDGWKSTGLLVPLTELKTVCKSVKGMR